MFSQFEQVSCTLNDVECWSARDLCTLLGYKLWQNFTKVIDKAKEACANVSQQVEDHFIDVNKMVVIGSGAERQVDDVMLTRYACYLVAQNGEPQISSEHIANNTAVRDMLVQRGIIPEDLPASEDIKKVGRRLASEEKGVVKSRDYVKHAKFVILYMDGEKKVYKAFRVKNTGELTREQMISQGYLYPRHDRYFCYFFDEEITLGEFDIEAIIEAEKTRNAEYAKGMPVYMNGEELIKFRR